MEDCSINTKPSLPAKRATNTPGIVFLETRGEPAKIMESFLVLSLSLSLSLSLAQGETHDETRNNCHLYQVRLINEYSKDLMGTFLAISYPMKYDIKKITTHITLSWSNSLSQQSVSTIHRVSTR